METSYNGWSASPTLKTVVIEPVRGCKLRVRDNPNVAVVFDYLVTNFHRRVEKVNEQKVPDDWGYNYRPDVNDPTQLSNHASGTAIDLDATEHPNDQAVLKSYTSVQIAEIHAILRELQGAVRWGGDYHHTIDGMHFEINVPPGDLHKIGRDIRQLEKKRGKYGYQLAS